MKEQGKVIHIPEKAVMEQIEGYLDIKHYWYKRINVGMRKDEDESKKDGYRYTHFGTPGFPDYIFAFPFHGIPIIAFIEAKSSTGKQTPDQIAFQQEVKEQGMLYVLAKGYEASQQIEQGINDYIQQMAISPGTVE